MIPDDFLALLRCPQSGQPFVPAGADILAPLNDRIAQSHGTVRTVGGVTVDKPLTEALLRTDRLLVYPISDGIPLLLAEEGILL